MLRLVSDEDLHDNIIRGLRRREPTLDIDRVVDVYRPSMRDESMLPRCLVIAIAAALMDGVAEFAFAQDASPPNAAEPTAEENLVSFPRAGVKFARPEGFQDGESFDGFGQPDTQSSVMATKIPGPYSQVSAGFTADNLRARGWTLLSKEKSEVNGLSGMLIHFRQPVGGSNFLKWALVFGDENKTHMVTATFPESLKTKLSKPLKTAVLSSRLTASPEPPLGADLDFTIKPSPKLKPATQIGKTLLYTDTGKVRAEAPGDPIFVVGPSLSSVPIGDQREFAERRLRGTAHTTIKTIESTKEATVDGLPGYEMIADAEDEKSKTPLKVYQLVLFDGGGYVLFQGLVGADQSDDYLPQFKAMARSFQRKTFPKL